MFSFLKYLPNTCLTCQSDLGLSFTVKKEENMEKEDVLDASNLEDRGVVRGNWLGVLAIR